MEAKRLYFITTGTAVIRTMFFIWERLKIVVEPTGVIAAAALLARLYPFLRTPKPDTETLVGR